MTDPYRIAGTHIVVRDDGYYMPKDTSTPEGRVGKLVRIVDPRLTARDIEIIAEHKRDDEYHERADPRRSMLPPPF